MGRLKQWEEEWLRPFLFYGNNWISLIGGAITTAAAFVLLGYWVVTLIGHGGSANPYTGIIFDFLLPALFVFGLVLIPIGMGWRRRSLYRAGQIPSVYPQVDFRDPKFRHAVDFVVVATFINFVIVGTASYRGLHGSSLVLRNVLPCDAAGVGGLSSLAVSYERCLRGVSCCAWDSGVHTCQDQWNEAAFDGFVP